MERAAILELQATLVQQELQDSRVTAPLQATLVIPDLSVRRASQATALPLAIQATVGQLELADTPAIADL